MHVRIIRGLYFFSCALVPIVEKLKLQKNIYCRHLAILDVEVARNHEPNAIESAINNTENISPPRRRRP
jgi:hypothetical protein